jgi:hypothetical protein
VFEASAWEDGLRNGAEASIKKARGGFSGAGFILATIKYAGDLPDVSKIFDAEIAERRERLK